MKRKSLAVWIGVFLFLGSTQVLALPVNPELLPKSVHNGLDCEGCHKGDTACAQCHADVVDSLQRSRHGKVFLKRFGSMIKTCEACHGDPHGIIKHTDSSAVTSRKNQPALCAGCHEIPSQIPSHLAKKFPAKSYLLTVHGAAIQNGNENAASCADCHSAHNIRPPADSFSTVSHNRIETTCGQCHPTEAAAFKSSVHGKALAVGVREAPTCTDCHGEHTIRPPGDRTSSVWKGAVTKTCSGCHASEKIIVKFGLPADRVQTYLDSFHGLAGQTGDLRVANCASCHGWHDVLPSSDPQSHISPINLAKTCNKCHPDAGILLTSAKIHTSLSEGNSDNWIAALIRSIYLVLIPLLIGGMLCHNLLDFLRKASGGKDLPVAHEQSDVLLTVVERWQHGWLVISFLILAYSGFALKYPESWWALPFAWAGGEAIRRNVHRIAALVFSFVAIFHFCYIAFSQRGWARLKTLLPEKRDLSDPIKLFLFNLRLIQERPALKRFSYIEKAEYWSLVWGSLVMITTGTILLFHNFALARFPLWVVEIAQVIHFLEAVLACLAIVVWHFYWVMFDPEIYPMNWAWFSGKKKL